MHLFSLNQAWGGSPGHGAVRLQLGMSCDNNFCHAIGDCRDKKVRTKGRGKGQLWEAGKVSDNFSIIRVSFRRTRRGGYSAIVFKQLIPADRSAW